MKDRIDIKNFILEIENDFPVNSWKVDTVHIWPILRYHVFFGLIYTIENDRLRFEKKEETSSDNTQSTNLINGFKQVLKWIWFSFILQKKQQLFFSPNHIRVNYNNRFFNRFFDSLIRLKGFEKSSYVFDYHQENKSEWLVENQEVFHSLLAYNTGYKRWNKLLRKFGLRKKKILSFDLNGYDDFLIYLQKFPETVHLANKYNTSFLTQYFNAIFENEHFFDKILGKTKPNQVYIICYYNPIMHSLLLSAKRKGIKVIEVQHGPMSNTHLSYTHWNKVPEEGYVFLPDEFWCWDQDSLNNMDSWCNKTQKHSAFLGGNPWLDYLKKNKQSVALPQNMVLYTLQPLAFEVLFPEGLLTLIRTRKWMWYIRLHPRQWNQKKEISDYLKLHGAFDMVNLEEAYTVPLPVLLENCLVHLTHFSGSAIEASMMNKYSIILDKLGEDTFKEIIQNQKAIYLPIDNQFSDSFENILNKL
ncbi:hypothetical protein [Flavobacterium enshiense]|uniref:Uncharacterized protein n=1 Tax=Flavobacterium enshiense DK69 TaxID=1107311 RepID=A0A0A2N9U5_9FLAO|nr:hypothetical protein [Flavobacterium enshiense]KGO97190.1 hypothetical protein Q767_00875 [Flavobacterium enshiense DK69]